MALIDKGKDAQFDKDLEDSAYECFKETNLDTVSDPLVYMEWLLDGAHKSDIGVIHRLIRDKLNR